MDCARRLLAFDCAGSSCSVVLWDQEQVRARRHEAMGRGQAERLVPMIEAVMTEAALDFAQLDAVAVTRGPGGFTGVRIGLATARGLALACRLPLLGVSNFRVAAQGVPAAERAGRTLVVALDAKRSDVFVQLYDVHRAPCGGPWSLAPSDLARHLPTGALILAGDGAEQVRDALRAARGGDLAVATTCGPADAAWLASHAATLPLPASDAPPPAPLYLRAPDVKIPGG